MRSLRVVFLGNDPWSVPTLESLAAVGDMEVSVVITNPPRPAGRGSELTPTAVSQAARRLELDVLETQGVRTGEGRDAIRHLHPDVTVVVAYGQLLSGEILDVPRLGSVNLHFSLLPRWRGAAPVQRAILEGDEITGVSVMLLDEGLDTGPVLASLEERIGPDDDTGSLGRRLAERGAPLVIDAIGALDAGLAQPIPQQEQRATHAAKLTARERVIDWSETADSVARRVRALAPAPGATSTFRGRALKILRAQVRGIAAPARPAAAGMVRVDADGVPTVGAGAFEVDREFREVALLEVAPAGRSRMSGADWARGARLEREERFT